MSDIAEVLRLTKESAASTAEFHEKQIKRIDAAEESRKMIEEFMAKATSPGIGQSTMGEPTAETKSFVQFMRSGRGEAELKSMVSGSDPSGGYLLPEQLESTLSKNLREISPMRQLATVTPVGGSDLKQVHSVGGTAYSWVGETSSRPETATPTLAETTIPTREVYAMPAISQNLLDDNVFSLEAWLTNELTEAFGDAEGAAFCTGNGVAQPRGLFTFDTATTGDATRAHGTFQYIPTGASGSFHTNKADPLISLIHAVKPRYRRNASWLMNPEVIEAIRKMKLASTEAYIWQPSLAEGQPSMLLGYPVFEDENAPAMGAGSLSVAFGDFSRSYVITDRSTAMLRDPYTAKPFVMFYASKRVGGGFGRDSNAVKFLKFAAS